MKKIIGQILVFSALAVFAIVGIGTIVLLHAAAIHLAYQGHDNRIPCLVATLVFDAMLALATGFALLDS
jgi:hypothetical protein